MPSVQGWCPLRAVSSAAQPLAAASRPWILDPAEHTPLVALSLKSGLLAAVTVPLLLHSAASMLSCSPEASQPVALRYYPVTRACNVLRAPCFTQARALRTVAPSSVALILASLAPVAAMSCHPRSASSAASATTALLRTVPVALPEHDCRCSLGFGRGGT